MNSINKGDISGTNAYGISTKVTYAFGVVSMGNAKGTVNSHSLWSDSAGIENIYVLDKTCNNCQSATQITKNAAGEYVIVGSNQRVDTVLNQISIDKQFGIIWTQELDLTNAVRVILDAPINKIVYLLPGSTIETVLTIHPFDIETLVPFNFQGLIRCKSETKFSLLSKKSFLNLWLPFGQMNKVLFQELIFLFQT